MRLRPRSLAGRRAAPLLVTLLALGATACGLGPAGADDRGATEAPSSAVRDVDDEGRVEASSAPSTSRPRPTTSTTAAPATTPPPTTTTTTTTPPEPTPEEQLRPGGSGPAVVSLQERLAELGYGVGAADGSYGARTASAVLAFQKVEGLARDGVPGPEVQAALAVPQGWVPSGGGPRIEIDLARQVLFVVGEGGTRILNTSTGNDEPFTWPDGTPGLAYTPTGEFSVLRRVEGTEHGPLGALYRPLYFYDGWAVHGSGHVPAHPASHGCARVSFTDQDWIWDNVANGTPVVVY